MGRLSMAVVAAGLLVPVACGGDPAPGPAVTPTTTAGPAVDGLQALAAPSDLVMGAAIAPERLDIPAYRDLLVSQYGSVTATNAMKWDATEPGPGRFTFGGGDAVVAFAEQHGMAVRGHTLVWHRQLPDWVTDGSFTPETLRSALERHIDGVAGHYRGRVASWDVVNEAVADDGTRRPSVFQRLLGDGWVGEAFRRAHGADPDALLFYNDYLTEVAGPKADAVHQLVAGLVADGVPVDGVGFQVHTVPGVPDRTELARQMRRYTALGLQVAVTELDVRLPVPPTPDDLRAQAATYGEVLAACLAVEQCRSFTTWGFTDAWSWVPQAFPGTGAALPYDESYRAKPARRALADGLRRGR